MSAVKTVAIVAFALAGVAACAAERSTPIDQYAPQPYVNVENADWTRNAVLYEMNTRHFTPEGTFAAAQSHLPRLAEMGVDIVWLMPIHPIGEVNRKGRLGSPYAVKDYRAINPDLGDEADLRNFVDEVHRLGMHVIIDWVANHSAWDNALTETNRDWYSSTPEGELTPPPGTDWNDTVDFNYANAGLREYMTESLLYWVREFDIDGYRADVAGFAPLDFWVEARRQLDAVKPVFMLAEWETRDLHQQAFDATYAWAWKNAMQETARSGGAGAVRGYYYNQRNTWPRGAYRMIYTDNHDQNAWDGVASEIYGDAYELAIALSFVGEGLPLIYGGQEADVDRKLSFFDKDEILWREGSRAELFRRLIELKHGTKALWNGAHGAQMVEVPNDRQEAVFSFVRKTEDDAVFAIFNLSNEAQRVSLSTRRHIGDYRDVLTGEAATFGGAEQVQLEPWGFRIYRSSN